MDTAGANFMAYTFDCDVEARKEWQLHRIEWQRYAATIDEQAQSAIKGDWDNMSANTTSHCASDFSDKCTTPETDLRSGITGWRHMPPEQELLKNQDMQQWHWCEREKDYNSQRYQNRQVSVDHE